VGYGGPGKYKVRGRDGQVDVNLRIGATRMVRPHPLGYSSAC
jgi:hypothetical protein